MGWTRRYPDRHRRLIIEIRAARTDDLTELPRVELSAAQAFRGRDVPARVFTEFTPSEAWAERQAAGTLWVAEVDGCLQAFLGATAHDDRLHIDEFAVAQDQQGLGLGRRMLGVVIGWARGAGFRRLTLTTFRTVPFNAPFYASAGFRIWDEAPPEIAAILANEAARGLKDRCAMVMDL